MHAIHKRRGGTRATVALLGSSVLAVAALAFAPAANAGFLTYHPGACTAHECFPTYIAYQDAVVERNDLVADAQVGLVKIVDRGNLILPSQYSPVPTLLSCQPLLSTAKCRSNDLALVFMALGNGDDRGSFKGPMSVSGGAGRDALSGGGGGQELDGGPGPDEIYGGAGNDHLNTIDYVPDLGSADGVDLLDGGDGDDTIDSRDGLRDEIRCGPGNDRLLADSADPTPADCETVFILDP